MNYTCSWKGNIHSFSSEDLLTVIWEERWGLTRWSCDFDPFHQNRSQTAAFKSSLLIHLLVWPEKDFNALRDKKCTRLRKPEKPFWSISQWETLSWMNEAPSWIIENNHQSPEEHVGIVRFYKLQYICRGGGGVNGVTPRWDAWLCFSNHSCVSSRGSAPQKEYFKPKHFFSQTITKQPIFISNFKCRGMTHCQAASVCHAAWQSLSWWYDMPLVSRTAPVTAVWWADRRRQFKMQPGTT